MNNCLVSIIIGSIRPVLLARCLESIKRHTSDVDYETVVVSPFEIESDPRVVHVKENPGGYYRAIADGYEVAQGEYIIHIADDCRAASGWAANMIAFMRPHDGEIFEGSFRHFDVRGEKPEQGHYGRLIAPFICIRKDVALRVGGLMDISYHRFFGDPDLSLRVWQHNGRVETCPDAWVYHCDFDDEQYFTAYNQFFAQDRQTFINRWHPTFGRQGDTPLGHEQPLGKWKPDKALPDEQCTKVYVSLLRRDWETVRTIVNSEDNDVYSEGFPRLHDLTAAMLRTCFYHRNVLYSVLEWMHRKGYGSARSTLNSERNLSLPRRLERYCVGIIFAIASSGLGRLVFKFVPDSLKLCLRTRLGLVSRIDLG